MKLCLVFARSLPEGRTPESLRLLGDALLLLIKPLLLNHDGFIHVQGLLEPEREDC